MDILDSMVRDILYACRSVSRAPLVAVTIVMTVGLGLGLVTVVFTILNAFVFRVDEVRNPHELFAVTRLRSANTEPAGFTRAQYEALVRETDVFSDAFVGVMPEGFRGLTVAPPDFWAPLALLGQLRPGACGFRLRDDEHLLSYLVEQRTREIGVRMALGATGRSIGALVLKQLTGPVALGLLLGGTLTAALGAALLATPAAETIAVSVRLFDPVACGGSLRCIVAACACAVLIPALRAGRIDPIAALRQD